MADQQLNTEEAKPLVTKVSTGAKTGAKTGPKPKEKTDDAPKEESTEKKGGKYSAVIEFRDSKNFDKIHKAGADVSHLGKETLERMIEAGYVKKG